MGLFWIGWLVLITIDPQNPWRLLPVLLSDALGAAALNTFYQQAPKALKTPFLGLSWGVLLVTVGDLMLLPGKQYLNLTGVLDPSSDYIFLLATISIMMGSFSLPYIMEQQGLYPNGRFALLIGIAAVISSVTVYLFTTYVTKMPFLNILIHAIIMLVFVLYLLQSFLIGGGRIGKQVQVVSIALTLVNVGRIIGIIGDWSPLTHTLYEIVWLTGMSVLLYFSPRKLA
ncbi:hypothetical protein DC3_34010 [Deinococcus cellulosilyticus NBRC 106333 = KACC 11606]|uniref:Uncharacterized protein n=2 Tax=Deinococcus cellulosilyticus TaxID=401558 RepID=A0A511N5Q6_DEIC1|nr:hypothetical protein DC3_34010 [Deinococcus cellulosilyticus NBRC 106333 = KACC 11606]